jgi:hypothetical protein
MPENSLCLTWLGGVRGLAVDPWVLGTGNDALVRLTLSMKALEIAMIMGKNSTLVGGGIRENFRVVNALASPTRLLDRPHVVPEAAQLLGNRLRKILNRIEPGHEWSVRLEGSDLEHTRANGLEIAVAHGHIEGHAEDVARLGGIDDGVDPEPRGRVANVCLAIVPQAKLIGHRRELGVVDLLPLAFERADIHVEHGPSRLLCAHDRIASTRPGEDKSRIERLATECVVSGAKGMSDDERDLGHGAIADGTDELGAPADDARALGVAADVETVDILDEQDRQPSLVTVEHEPRGLIGAVGVDDSSKLKRPTPLGTKPQSLCRHDPQRESFQRAEAAHKRAAVFGPVFVEPAAVEDPGE